MKARLISVAVFAAALAAPAALAQDAIRDGEIYGSQLMTSQERNDYRQRLQAATTEQERERIRAEHHDRMQQRAKERGVTLPDKPVAGRGPTSGSGMGPGPGGAKGAGPGGGRAR